MSVTMVRRSDQNVPEQKGEASPGDISKGKRLRGQPTTRWGDYISDLTWSRLGVEPTELSEVSENREVF